MHSHSQAANVMILTLLIHIEVSSHRFRHQLVRLDFLAVQQDGLFLVYSHHQRSSKRSMLKRTFNYTS